MRTIIWVMVWWGGVESFLRPTSRSPVASRPVGVDGRSVLLLHIGGGCARACHAARESFGSILGSTPDGSRCRAESCGQHAAAKAKGACPQLGQAVSVNPWRWDEMGEKVSWRGLMNRSRRWLSLMMMLILGESALLSAAVKLLLDLLVLAPHSNAK